MYKIAVIGDYDSIYGFAALGLSICPVKTREETRDILRRLAGGNYGIIYITEAAAAQVESEIEEYREKTLPAIIRIPGGIGEYRRRRERREEDRGAGGRIRYSVWRSK